MVGHSCLYQEGVRQEVQPDVALHRGAQLRLVRDPRDAPLHLLLLGPGGNIAFQERLIHSSSIPENKQKHAR